MNGKKRFVFTTTLLIATTLMVTSANAQLQGPCKEAEEYRLLIEELSGAQATVITELTDQQAQFEQIKDELDEVKELLAKADEELKLNIKTTKELKKALKEAQQQNDEPQVTELTQKLVELDAQKVALKTEKKSLKTKFKELKKSLKPIKKEIKRLKKITKKNEIKLERFQTQYDKKKEACKQWHAAGCPTKELMEKLGPLTLDVDQIAGLVQAGYCKQIKDAKATDLRCKPAILPPICTDMCFNRITNYMRFHAGLERARTMNEEEKRNMIKTTCPLIKPLLVGCPFKNHRYCE